MYILITNECTTDIIIDYFNKVQILASTDNELPEDGVIAPKHVGAI
jgi:hypothetical protein